MRRAEIPGALRDAVAAELSPVVPLEAPWRRSRLLLPVALATLLGIHLGLGLRLDADRIGAAALWGLSALQVAAGVALLVAALRESVPGRALGRGELLVAFLGLGLWIGAVSWLTWLRSPTLVPAGREAFYTAWCIAWPVALSLPLLALGLYLARRAFPLRPYLVGALLGAASGAIVDAGWHTFCEVSAPGHVLHTHALALVAATAVGVLGGALLARRSRLGAGRRRA